MSKKTNFFVGATSELEKRVSNALNCVVWGAILRKRSERIIDGLEAQLADLNDDDWEEVDPSKHDERVAEISSKIEDAKKRLSDRLSAEAHFEYSDADITLFNSYKDGNDLRDALKMWFFTYDIDVQNDVLTLLESNLGGARKLGNNAVLKSGGRKFLDKRTKNDFLQIFYRTLGERLIEKHVIDVKELPKDIRKLYEKKNK